jgi:CPA1 family monovalent cation:H+ antiporter
MSFFLAFALLLCLTAVLGVVNERYLRLEPSIGLMLLAILMTLALAALKAAGVFDALSGVQALFQKLDLSEVLLNGVLCFMLFAGSTGVKFELLRENEWAILSLALGSTIIACGIVGALLSWGLGLFGVELPLVYAFVFGALISPTDPIAALAILKPVGLPKRLEAIINGESLFNDGVGVVLFTLALAQTQGSVQEASPLSLFLRAVLGGVGLGLLVGFATNYLLLRTKDFGNQLLTTLATVSLGYQVAFQVEVSGPIAMVVAGLIVGNVTLPRLTAAVRNPIEVFWNGVDDILNSLLFVMMGLSVVAIHELDGASLSKVVPIAILVCLIARAISVYVPIAILTRTRKLDADALGLTKLLTWGGLRGGLALALALSLPPSAQKPLIINMTFAVVAFSILVQGATISRLFTPTYLKTILKPDRS